jgi:HK97 family phage major capsid protein
MPAKTLDERINDLEAQAEKVLQEMESDPGNAGDLKAQVDGISQTLDELKQEKDQRDRDDEVKSLREQVTTLSDALKDLRTPSGLFGRKADVDEDRIYGPDSSNSFYADIKAANKGHAGALERMAKALGTDDVKAMTEGTDASGGYLVNPQISSELIRLRYQAARVRPLFSSVDVQSDTLQIAAITGGLAAGWVPELEEKIASDLTFGQVSVSVFTAAGLAVVSNQLLADSRPSVDGLINEELARRLGLLEELAFLDGSGTGQPRGILNTAGVGTTLLTSTDVVDLLDAIYDAIVGVQTEYFGDPNRILMHPRTWARLVKERESATSAIYILGSGANDTGRRGSDGLPTPTLFGVPVTLTNQVPTTKGVGNDESRVIVGAFNEGLILDRQAITTDESTHVFFTSNQTVFRAESRVGFTAARYPKAFNVVGGTGLAGG